MKCPDCNSTDIWGNGDGKCAHCHGGGYGDLFDQTMHSANILEDGDPQCDECNGSGECQTCGGTGEVDDEDGE